MIRILTDITHSGSKTFRMLDWKALPAFLAVARHGSLRAAAAQLGGTHATARRQVEALEAQLGVQLFRRGADGFRLTAAGRTLLPQALEAETALLRGFNAVQGLDREASGRIRVSADPLTGHFMLAPVLAEFAALYPEIDVELQLSYGIDSIEKLETDVSIRSVAEVDEDVVGRKLFPAAIGIFAARSYLDRRLPAAGPKGQGLQWIGYGPVPELLEYIERSPFPEARVRHTIPDPEMHLHMARAGAGLALLSAWVEAKFPELQRVPGTQLDERRSLWVLLHSDLRRVRRVRLFVDYLCDALVERRSDFIGA
ncbi:LysR family transcriptional regulator [Oceanicola granulosus]|nr:LysR family transcriptional regulator [Oceanicola granulosus]